MKKLLLLTLGLSVCLIFLVGMVPSNGNLDRSDLTIEHVEEGNVLLSAVECEEAISYIYRRMKTSGGSFINSPLDGAPNSSQKGARTKGSSNYPDLPVNNRSGNVGPSYTGKAGLSASLDQEDGGKVHVDNLPSGVGYINDSGRHVSLYPSRNMTFGEFQTKLNSIPWQ